jgi:hypothetical protein
MRDPITSSTGAKILNCPESTFRFWVSREPLTRLRLPSGITLYERAEIEALADSRRERVAADAK